MRKTFLGYYRPTEDEFSELWKNCLFVLDANVLLNLYRYSPQTRENLISILEEISDRLWVPHQAGLEYQRNRLAVIEQQTAAYGAVQKLLRDTQNKLENDLRSFARHPSIEVNHLLERINNVFAETEEKLNELKQGHPDLLDHDYIRDTITTLLEGKVGSPYTSTRMSEIYKEGKARYESEIPPGYLDVDKGGTRQYCDLVLWFQVIDKAEETKKSIILITDDRKDDWWLRFKGRTIGPQPELVQEIVSQAGVSFYMYSADPFMEHARKYLESQVKQAAIDEVRDIRQHDEGYIRAAQAEAFRLLSEEIRGLLQQLAYPTEEIRRALQQIMYPTEGMQRVLPQTSAFEEMRRVLQQQTPVFEEMRRILQQTSAFEEMRRVLQQQAPAFEEMRRALQQASTFWILSELTTGAKEGKDISLNSGPEEALDESSEQTDTKTE